MIWFQIFRLSHQLRESWDNNFSSNKVFSSMIGLFSRELIPLLPYFLVLQIYKGKLWHLMCFWSSNFLNQLVISFISLIGVFMHFFIPWYWWKYPPTLLMKNHQWKIWMVIFSGISTTNHTFSSRKLEYEILLKGIESSITHTNNILIFY